jgi:hypothetical protein
MLDTKRAAESPASDVTCVRRFWLRTTRRLKECFHYKYEYNSSSKIENCLISIPVPVASQFYTSASSSLHLEFENYYLPRKELLYRRQHANVN